MSIYKGSEPALLGGSAVMDDEVTLYSTWSSKKIKDEIENGGAGLNKEVVAALPTDPHDISDRTIYMVPNGETDGETLYDKYIRDTVNNRWEKLNADSDAVKSGDFIQLLKDNTDTSLSATSEKPVQNKVVKAELDAIRNSQKPLIYGVMWNGSKSTKLTRIDDAAGLDDPVPYFEGITEECYSPFDTIMPWAGMERVTDAEAGELVKIPKFYYRFTNDGKALKLQISNSKVPGFHTSPAHMNRGDGAGERDYVYIGRYHCAENTYKSTTGVKPQVNITRANARTAIHNLGSGIWQMDFAMRLTIWILYLVEFANWNAQQMIGSGGPNTSAAVEAVYDMGNTDSLPYHTGTVSGSHGAYGACQYRWIEGLWNNCYDWLDGCYSNSSGFHIILNPTQFSDTENGTLVGELFAGFPTVLTVSETVFPMFYPTVDGGSNSTYIPDYWYSGNGTSPCHACGADRYRNQDRGLFCIRQHNLTDAPDTNGCRLMKLS